MEKTSFLEHSRSKCKTKSFTMSTIKLHALAVPSHLSTDTEPWVIPLFLSVISIQILLTLSKNICRCSAGFETHEFLLPQRALGGQGGSDSDTSAGDAPATLSGGARADTKAWWLSEGGGCAGCSCLRASPEPRWRSRELLADSWEEPCGAKEKPLHQVHLQHRIDLGV